MFRKYLSFLVILLLPCFAGHASSSSAADIKDPHLADVVLTTSETSLLVFGKLKNGFTDEMLQGLHNGIPIQFSYFIELIRERRLWTDEQVATMEIHHVLTYDTLKETYKVDMEEGGRKSLSFSSLEQAKKAMSELGGVKIVKLSKLIPDDTYTLRIRADLFKKTLPMGLHHVVPFVSWWDVKTTWYSVHFNY